MGLLKVKSTLVTVLVTALLVVSSNNIAWAWKSSDTFGPLIVPAESEGFEPFFKSLTSGQFGSAATSISKRVIRYPRDIGVRLGVGWDYARNQRTFAKCITGEHENQDSFQEATIDYRQTIDEESLFSALNFSMSAKAKASYKVFKANASASVSFKSTLKTTSLNNIVVGHASVVNGAQFLSGAQKKPRKIKKTSLDLQYANGQKPDPSAIALSNNSIKLSKEALTLLERNPALFRRMCGDGFIVSIVSGLDLYVLYQFTKLTKKEWREISGKVSGGMSVGDLFGGSMSMSGSSTVEKMIKAKKLNVYLYQSGGKIGDLGISIAEINSRLKSLAAEARDGPKPLYMVAIPYEELVNWPGPSVYPIRMSYRASLLRYFRRMSSVLNEFHRVVRDLMIDDTAKPVSDRVYLHDYKIKLRKIDYLAIRKKIIDELTAIAQHITVLDSELCASGATSKECADALSKLPKLVYDDSYFYIQLPVPKHVISEATEKVLVAGASVHKKHVYSRLLYRHWVVRIDNFRCSRYFDCMKRKRLTIHKANILASLEGKPLSHPRGGGAPVEYTKEMNRLAETFRSICAKPASEIKDKAEKSLCGSSAWPGDRN